MGESFAIGLIGAPLIVAVLSSYTALDLAARATAATAKNSHWWLIGSALALGTGMWSVHFVGMLAVKTPFALTYEALPTAISWLIAVLLGGIALRVAIGSATRIRLVVAV